MKTPMQFLLEKIENGDFLNHPKVIGEFIKYNLLEKEKEQIMRAFYEGMGCQGFDQNMGRAEIYYNETYNKMTLKDAIEVLRRHNKWRRGDDSVPMTNPKLLGQAIDTIVEELAETNRGDGGYGSTNEPVHFTVKMESEWRGSEEFKQRIKYGMQKAKDEGKHIGRPIGSTEDADQFIAKHMGVKKKLDSGSHSIREIANSEGVSPGTVMKVKKTLAELRLFKPLDIEQPFT